MYVFFFGSFCRVFNLWRALNTLEDVHLPYSDVLRTSAERIVSQNRLKMNAFASVLIVSLAVVLCFRSIAGEPVRINKDAVFVAYAFPQRPKNADELDFS
jgi:hypothetical protein